MLVDNCPAHKCEAIQDSLDHVDVVFLPPNTTSIIQPCNAGIINAFKLNYRRLMLRKVGGLVDNPTIEKLDTKALKKNINMLHCLQYAKDAWQSVTETTVQNCWRKAGFSAEMQATEDNTVSEVQSELAEDIQELSELDKDAPVYMQLSENAEQIVQVIDDELTSNEAEAEAESEDDDDKGGASPTAAVQPSTLELFRALDALSCGLYVGKMTIAFTTMLRRLRTSFCLRRLREHSKHHSLNSSQISNVLQKKCTYTYSTCTVLLFH